MEERNDAFQNQARIPLERYEFARDCLMGEKLIVDVGCGVGYGCNTLSYTGAVVVGLDVFRGIKYPYPFVLANAETQTFSGFPALVCLEALSHFLDPYVFMKNLKVPRVVISMPTIPSKDIYPFRKHDISRDTFLSMFTPKWKIQKTLVQQEYLTVYATH